MARKRKANSESPTPRKQRPIKNDRVEKHCNNCEMITTHSVTASGRIICVPCNSTRQKQYTSINKNKPAVQVCQIHPCNTHRSWSGNHCGCCHIAQRLASNSRADDKRRNLVCKDPSGPLSAAFINSLQGDLCDVCLDPCYVLYDPSVPNNPWCLSVGRRRTGIAHDCNRENMVAEHNLCNKFKSTLTNKEIEPMLVDGWKFAVNCGKIQPNLPNAVLSCHKRGSAEFGASLLSLKASNAKKENLEFDRTTMTRLWLENQYNEVQKGCCAACGGLLHNDISFNRVDPTKRIYTASNVNLMHTNCNMGLGNWPISELHFMFLKAYQNRHPEEFKFSDDNEDNDDMRPVDTK